MSKVFESIFRGANEALEFSTATDVAGYNVHVPEIIDVRAIRERLQMSQQAFAVLFGFSVGTLRHWEQGSRKPEGPAKVLLTVIDREPELVARALQEPGAHAGAAAAGGIGKSP